jgi:hypothetical protein
VHSRILLGVAAWLVGAIAATGGSLLAVSVLGQGMDPAGEQVSVETVNRALAKEAAGGTAVMPRRSVSPSASRNAPQKSCRLAGSAPSLGTGGGTVLTSPGGTVVASCAGARAYLVSWSPQQGFGSSGVVRGPATNAQVTFTGGQITVTTVVSCDAGAPTATTTAVSATPVSSSGGDGE